MRDKLCPVCGDDLASLPWGKGTVWQCTDHGVKEWYFEADLDDRWASAASLLRGLGLAEGFRSGDEPQQAPEGLRPRESDFRRR